VEAYFGISKAGGVVVPLNTAADAHMLGYFLGDSGAKVLVVGSHLERLVRRLAGKLAPVTAVVAAEPAKLGDLGDDVDLVAATGPIHEVSTPPSVQLTDEDDAAIIYTSGSTGRPRGATLTHRNLVTNTLTVVEYLALQPSDRVLAVLPFHYVYGASVLNTHVAAGATVVIENRFRYSNVALDTLEAEGCTGFSGVPSTFAILLNRSNLAERSLSELRYVTQAGGALSPALIRRLIEVLPRQQIFIMYGATEASARLAYLPPDQLADAIGSIGYAIAGVELRVLRPDGNECHTDEIGELVARGPNIMRGYWNAPEETARVIDAHGYHTGDLARRDGKDRLWIVGRREDMIKSGGHRIAPQEIEEAILEHPAVHETAVIGVPDELLGERIVAFVVPKVPTALDELALGRFLGDRLPAYKLPRAIELRDDLPKNDAGKISKQVLRDGWHPPASE
jgi:acyl-CoA synthetase (AMP-forming)/AMP-acid ligase II